MENSPNYNIPQEETIDIRKFLITILRNWYWFAISILITYTIAFLVNRYTEPRYSLTATLIVNDEKKSTAEILINALDRFNARRNIENEIAILKSYKIARMALSQLPDFEISYYSVGRVRKPLLYKKAPFKVVVDTTSKNFYGAPIHVTILSESEYLLEIEGSVKKKMMFGERFKNQQFNFTVFSKFAEGEKLPVSNKYYFVINDLNSLTNFYRGKLSLTTNDKKGTVLILSTIGYVPQMEADYLNKLMEVYIQSGLDEKNQTAINTINFIDEQLSTVVDSLRKAEDKMLSFRLSSKIIDISSEGQSIMARMSKVQADKVNYDLQLRYYNYVKTYIDQRRDFRQIVAPSVMGIDDPILNKTVSELAGLYAERNVLTLSAQSNNPALTLLNTKIQSMLDALDENIKEIIKSTEIALNEIARRQASIEKEVMQLPLTERRYLNIQRDFKLNDDIYNFLLQKRADAAIARASNVADNKILDEASAENPVKVSPKPGRNKMIAIIIGILIPLSILILIEFFNEKIIDPKDIDKITKVPVLGSVGHNEKQSEIPVAENPKSSLAESFRALRTNLQYVMRDTGKKVICVTSTISGEGKTFCAVNLASIIAQSNKKTLLISLDLRKPKVHKVFNIDNERGLSTFLIGKSDYNDIIIKTNIHNLYITPAGPIPPNPAELIETKEMETFVQRIREDFDIIVMDTPPIAIVTDAVLLSRFSDAVIFVVRQNYSTKDVIHLVDDLHEKKDIKNIGILINDIKVSSYYGYGRRYNYGYGYGYGYNYSDGEDYYNESPQKLTYMDKVIRFLFRG